MDPNATLADLLRAIQAGDRDLAEELADALANWIRKGGFLPEVKHDEHDGRNWWIGYSE